MSQVFQVIEDPALNSRQEIAERIRAKAAGSATEAHIQYAKSIAEHATHEATPSVAVNGSQKSSIETISTDPQPPAPIQFIRHQNNAEEIRYKGDEKYFTNFTKGLAHDDDGFIKSPEAFEAFAKAVRNQGPTGRNGLSNKVSVINQLPIGDLTQGKPSTLKWHFYNEKRNVYNALNDETPTAITLKDEVTFKLESNPQAKNRPYRRWEAPTAGVVFDLQGPDTYATYMPPAPTVVIEDNKGNITANPELVAEMAEVYWLALLRDVPLRVFDTVTPDQGASDQNRAQVDEAVNYLKALEFYKEHPNNAIKKRLRRTGPQGLDRNSVFGGQTKGDITGPYLSQFLLLGTPRLGNGYEFDEADYSAGHVNYGSICMDLRVRQATPFKDYMTHWNEWLDVQNGGNVRDGMQTYVSREKPNFHRFISTPRDLATYVHFDALYEAYLNACIILLGLGAPLDPGFDHLSGGDPDVLTSTEGFALFGGPHILTLVTEVATRALKAVRFQKFNVHLRARPEVLAGRVAFHEHGDVDERTMPLFYEDMGKFVEAFKPSKENPLPMDLLDEVAKHNEIQNQRYGTYLKDGDKVALHERKNVPLLPMAFPEGSPMHPSYGAGHATVAGACVTMLKAFFNTDSVMVWDNMDTVNGHRKLKFVPRPDYDKEPTRYSCAAFVPSADGLKLDDVGHELKEPLTLEDELNKLAANISIGRNMAGVHYYSDYIDSLRMGEYIAMQILEEQSYTYQNDNFAFSLNPFDDIEIKDGKETKSPPIQFSSKPLTNQSAPEISTPSLV